MSALHFVDVSTWFTDHIHEGYEKIPYRGRTGPDRKLWWEKFQKWTAEDQLKVVNDFAQFYNTIYDAKKLDTARRIIHRMAELFELVPWLRERMYHKQLMGFKDEITVYEHLVDNVERLFREEGFPEPDLVRRLVDRMAVLVRPKLFWKLIELKKPGDGAVGDLKDQWEIFVSAKMSKHEFKDFFLWMFKMIEWSPYNAAYPRAKICQVARDVVVHSFSGPRTGVRLLPVRVLSNNPEVLDRFCAMIGVQSGEIPNLKDGKSKDDLETFMEKLVVKEMSAQTKETVAPNNMDVDSVSSRPDAAAVLDKLDDCLGFTTAPAEPFRFFSDTNSSAGRSSVPPSLPPENSTPPFEEIPQSFSPPRSRSRSRPASEMLFDNSVEPPRKKLRVPPLITRQPDRPRPSRIPFGSSLSSVSADYSWRRNPPPSHYRTQPAPSPRVALGARQTSNPPIAPNPADRAPSGNAPSALSSLSGRRMPIQMTLDKFAAWIRQLQLQQKQMEHQLTNRIRQQIQHQEQQIRARAVADGSFLGAPNSTAPQEQWSGPSMPNASPGGFSMMPSSVNSSVDDEISFFGRATPAPQTQNPIAQPQNTYRPPLSSFVPPPVSYESTTTRVPQNVFPPANIPAGTQFAGFDTFNSLPPQFSQMGDVGTAPAFPTSFPTDSWPLTGTEDSFVPGSFGMDLDVPNHVFASDPLQPPLEMDGSFYSNPNSTSCWDTSTNAGSFTHQWRNGL